MGWLEPYAQQKAPTSPSQACISQVCVSRLNPKHAFTLPTPCTHFSAAQPSPPSLPPSTLCFPTPTAAAHSHPNLPDRAVLAKDICIACKHEICHACKHQAGMALCVFHACMQESMHENQCIHACKNPCTCMRPDTQRGPLRNYRSCAMGPRHTR